MMLSKMDIQQVHLQVYHTASATTSEEVVLNVTRHIHVTKCSFPFYIWAIVTLDESINLTFTMFERSPASLFMNSSLAGSLVPCRMKSGR